jgi:hypothetical protein
MNRKVGGKVNTSVASRGGGNAEGALLNRVYNTSQK